MSNMPYRILTHYAKPTLPFPIWDSGNQNLWDYTTENHPGNHHHHLKPIYPYKQTPITKAYALMC